MLRLQRKTGSDVALSPFPLTPRIKQDSRIKPLLRLEVRPARV